MLSNWIELREESPVDLSRVISHANSFNSLVGIRISKSNLDRAKKSLIDASAELEAMYISLLQLLHDNNFLKKKTDNCLYEWLRDNTSRHLKSLDEREDALLSKVDERVIGISRLSTYAKHLKVSYGYIYESLYKSIKEYNNFKETKEIKKDKRTFLYILFQVLGMSMFIAGGLVRDDKPGSKKISVGASPTAWQSMLNAEGQRKIAEEHIKETGEKISVDEYLLDKDEENEEEEKKDESDDEESEQEQEDNQEEEEDESD